VGQLGVVLVVVVVDPRKVAARREARDDAELDECMALPSSAFVFTKSHTML
jgi:hypothetical protein